MEFADLVQEHQAMVFSVAFHFFRERALAEDLAQDTFLHLHQSLAGLDSAAHVKFWLRKTISHRCIDESRRRRRRPRLILHEIEEPSVPAEMGDIFLSDKLRKLIETLPGRARLVVILRYQEDLEPSEIARVLTMPVGTVKSNLHRSLAVLRAKLNRASQRATS